MLSAVGLVIQGAQVRQGGDSRKIRKGVLALERELSEWSAAMEVTSRGLDKWIRSSGTEGMEAEFLEAQSAMISNSGYVNVVHSRTEDLSAFLRVYAPAVAESLTAELSRRKWLLDFVMLNVKRAFENEGEYVARYWLGQLEESRTDLVTARDQLRAFIREQFPAHT